MLVTSPEAIRNVSIPEVGVLQVPCRAVGQYIAVGGGHTPTYRTLAPHPCTKYRKSSSESGSQANDRRLRGTDGAKKTMSDPHIFHASDDSH